MKPMCFLDMDGVIANFVGAVSKAHGKPYPYDDPTNHGVFDVDTDIWKMSAREFWKPCNENPEFWHTLEKMPDADQIVELVCQSFGEDNVAILTAPSMDPYCVPGKREWITQRYPQFKKRMIFTGAKHFLAGPGKFLVDDKDKNIADFQEQGGYGILVPRLWNAGHSDVVQIPSVLHTLKHEINEALSTFREATYEGLYL